jgi:hypothetical protein
MSLGRLTAVTRERKDHVRTHGARESTEKEAEDKGS